MRRRLAIGITVAAAALAGVLLAVGLTVRGGDDAPRLVPAAERAPAPALSVAALDGGGRIDLAEHRGRPVVLNFWAAWCEPCKEEMPALVAFARADRAVDVIGVATTDSAPAARAFARRQGATFPLGQDPRGDAARRFDVPGLPTTVVIDAQGRVALNHPGPLSPSDLDSIGRGLAAG
ncbi:MAG: TlpA family protein disulfide reductase [Thermoleophilia bacterium]